MTSGVDSSAADRAGVALIVVLVLVLALTVLGHGALVLARSEAAGATALVRAVEDRLVGRAVLESAVREAVADTLLRLPVGAADSVALGAGGRRVLERLSSEIHLLTAAADTAGRGRSAVVWVADPVTRITETAAVVTTGGTISGAERIVSTEFFSVEAQDEPWCDPWVAALDSLASTRPPPSAVGVLDVGGAGGSALAALRLGLLEADTLTARLTPHPPGTVTPGPGSGSVTCSDEPDSWGTPTDPSGPCGDRRVGLFVEGSLELAGGEGQGVIAVTGDLVLRDGAVLAGLVFVGGELRLEGASTVRGVVRTGGGVSVGPDAEIEGAACPVVLAIAASPDLRRPLRLAAPLLAFR